MKYNSCCFSSIISPAYLFAQDTVRYTGKTLVQCRLSSWSIIPAIGVHNIQTMRANRGRY